MDSITRANYQNAVVQSETESISTKVTWQHQLDKLPLEIVRRIVTSGSCENALVLSRVNRRLRTICYDPLLFKTIVENGNGGTRSESSSWWNTAVGTIVENTSLAARWALADSKIISAGVEVPSPGGKTKRTLDWLLPLLIVGHPSSQRLVQTWVRQLHIRAESLTDEPPLAAFFFAYQMSQSSATTALEGYSELYNVRMEDAFRILTPLFPSGGLFYSSILLYLLDLNSSSLVHAVDRYQWLQVHVQAMTTVGVLAAYLRLAQVIVGMPVGTLGRLPTLAPPEPSDIPLASLTRSPAPYSQISGPEFISLYVGHTARRHFLENGEWVGVYCYSTYGIDERPPVFDPEMEGIRFQVLHADESGVLKLSGRGRDGWGGFQLHGQVGSTTGLVLMDKVYEGGNPRWSWSAALTPFGMVGSWGSTSWGGWFWLWKRAWSKERAVNREEVE